MWNPLKWYANHVAKQEAAGVADAQAVRAWLAANPIPIRPEVTVASGVAAATPVEVPRRRVFGADLSGVNKPWDGVTGAPGPWNNFGTTADMWTQGQWEQGPHNYW